MGLPFALSGQRRPSATQGVAALVLLAGLTWWGRVLAQAPWHGSQAPFPYVWRDVAIVYLLCSLPLAGMMAVFVYRRLPSTSVVVLAALLLGISPLLLLDAAREEMTNVCRAQPSFAVLARSAPALGLTSAVALLVLVLSHRPRNADTRQGPRHHAVVGGLGLLLLLLLPATYVSARCRHDVAQLGELLEQSRFGEARLLVQGLLVLDADASWQGHPLPKVAAEIERVLRELNARVAVPLPEEATAGERLERARLLAILGRTEEALAVLNGMRASAIDPEVESLYATIRESAEDWNAALKSYRTAQATWEAQPPAAARTAGLVRATTGIAYCQRKLGHYAEAEAAYQQVLKLSPTADAHFLLAQFYEDTQEGEKARAHARRAIALSPTRYGAKGEKLIEKLTVHDFSCLSVFRAESNHSAGSLAPLGDNPSRDR